MGNATLEIARFQANYVENTITKCFGRPDAARFLTQSDVRKSEQTNWLLAWERIASRLFSLEEKACFEETVTPFLIHEYQGDANTVEFLKFLKAKNVDVYSLGREFLVRYTDDDFGRQRTIPYRYYYSGNPSHKLGPSEFVRYIVANRQDYKLLAKGGWESLKARLDQVIKTTRLRAMMEFDNACAMSQDGETVVYAKKVWILKPDFSLTAHDPDKFVPRKLPVSLNHHTIRSSHYAGDRDPVQAATDFRLFFALGGFPDNMHSYTAQITPAEGHEMEFPSIFIISESLVPPDLL